MCIRDRSKFVGIVSAVVAPHVVGAFTYHSSTRSEWQKVFFMAAGIQILGAIVFVVFGSGNQQSWAGSTEEQQRSNETVWYKSHTTVSWRLGQHGDDDHPPLAVDLLHRDMIIESWTRMQTMYPQQWSIYSVSQKIPPPLRFSEFVPNSKRMGIFSINFYAPIVRSFLH